MFGPNNTLSSQLALKFFTSGTNDPSLVATEGNKGSLYIRYSGRTGNAIGLYQKQDDGISTNWISFNSGPSGAAWGSITGTITNQTDLVNYVSSQVNLARITDVYYVDGDRGDDLTATGSLAYPFKTIQAAINYVGQPVDRQDALRHIIIYISGKQALPGALFSGIYTENLTVPNRFMTLVGYGIKIDGNILKEYSSSRRFGVSSSEFRPCLTTVGLNETRDSHPRIRNGFYVGGTCRTSILRRNADSIQGNGVNKITVHLTAGQFTYPITISTPAIRITVQGTASYNATYDITAQIGPDTFEATRISGTNAAIGIESGSFFESDSAGASGVTHDAHFINTYMQGQYTCDDGTVNGAAPTAGTEVLYAVGVRFFTGIEGRTILMQRWENNYLAGTFIVNSIAGMNNCSMAGNMTVNTFTYSADDQAFTNCRFDNAITFTVNNAGQTVRMDGVTLTSFLATGSSWAVNTPTIAYLNDSKGLGYTPTTPADWAGTAPKTVQEAMDRMSTLLKTLNGGVPIP